ncbi:hypothetical protein LCD35_17470, partial [Saccharopolyspora sp. 6V]|nr:hypothetical protein [Saccharopolyspora sp. 6V]
MSGPLRVLLDGTPLLGRRTGIGRYTASLSAELGRMSDVDARAIGFTARGWRALRGAVPPGVRATGVPVPARAVRALWTRGGGAAGGGGAGAGGRGGGPA